LNSDRRYSEWLKDAIEFVGVVEPNLRRAEIERARRKRPDNLGAYDLYPPALPFCASAMPEDAELAIGLLEQALKLDAKYAAAHA
jgi:adenylate cyclase